MNNVKSPFDQILASINPETPAEKFPTMEDWKRWYGHQSNKERVLEAESNPTGKD
jgi:hypothetical protein